MSSDPNKKSARTFQCRDVLWETFEQMARELECSVDYLINEAMKQYARQRSYGSRTPFPAGASSRAPAAEPNTQGGILSQPPPAVAQGVTRSAPLPPPPAAGARQGVLSAPPPRGPGGLPPPPGAPRTAGYGMPTPPPPRAGGSNLPPPRSGTPRSVPPPLPRGVSGMPPSMAGNGYSSPAPSASTLNVIYQGEKVAIAKDRFVIGRGKQSSDLTLKDPNVSRQHAMVEYQNGVYFMVDMGSTNGVEYNGQRIARKQIAEGDVFRICDHDLFFTYR